MRNPYFEDGYNPYPQSVLLGTAVLFIILPVAAVSLRFYARSLTAATIGIDDWMTIPSMLICVGLSINQIIAATLGGLGGHLQLVNGQLEHTDQLYAYEKTKYAYQVLGTVGLVVVKLSVLFFYRRIFTVRKFHLLNNFFIGLTLAWGVAFTFAVAFQCNPASIFWEKFEYEYGDHCVVVQDLYLAVAVSDLLLDIFIFLLPVPHLYKLQMPLRRKLAVGGIFLLGAIVVAIGVTRVIIFEWVIDYMTLDPFGFVYDVTWKSSGVLFWHLAENVVGLIGCCLPTYRPVLSRYLPNMMKSSAVGSSDVSGMDSRKRTWQSNYRQQNDDEWPLAVVGGTLGDSVTSASSRPADGKSEVQAIPLDRIGIRREFHAETSLV